jgi:hypothetical protein
MQQDGHPFNISGKTHIMHGALLCVVGDTPAVSLVGGFKEGVGFALKKCRHCMANNTQIQEKFTEEEFVLRTLQLHLTQCSYVERPGISSEEKQHFSKVYGVNRKSILCDLPDFDITTQLPQDIMHVLFEGLFHLQVRLFLNYLIDDLKAITLADFNNALARFPYAYFEDKPHGLTAASLKKGILGQTAHESWQLFHVLPFLVGDCISEDNEHLRCYLLLQDIASILCTDAVTTDRPAFLRLIVQDYLTTLKKLYPSLNLPPKAHYLVHCPTLLKRFGPMIRVWSMRFEAKHRQFKQVCRRTSFKNLLKTLTINNQCLTAYNIHCSDVFSKICTVPGAQCVSCCIEDLLHHDDLTELLCSVGVTSPPTTKVQRYNHAVIAGTTYRVDLCYLLVKSEKDDHENLPVFGRLNAVICLSGSKDIIFGVKVCRTVKYVQRFAAYEIQETADYMYFFSASLKCHYLFNCSKIAYRYYIKSKYDLCGYL